MERTNIGSSGVSVSRIAFGAWAIGGSMWGGTDRIAARDAIAASLDQGITTFDTAPGYGWGLSEELLGDALVGRRAKVEILDKFGLRWDTDKGSYFFDSTDNDGRPVKVHRYASSESVVMECERSLKRLKTDYIDLYQIHWPDPTTRIEETMDAVRRLRDAGKIRAAGVCNYSVDECRRANAVVPVVSMQMPYSMVKREIESSIVPFCMREGRAILAYSPLQSGVLTGKVRPGQLFAPGDFRAGTSYYRSPNLERINAMLARIEPLADARGASLAQVVIAWTLRQPGISCALVGARDRTQALANGAAADIRLDRADLDRIAAALAELRLET